MEGSASPSKHQLEMKERDAGGGFAGKPKRFPHGHTIKDPSP